jgi:polyphosphate kinase
MHVMGDDAGVFRWHGQPSHFLSRIPYGEVQHASVHLPEWMHHEGYERHALPVDMYVPRQF